MQQFPFDRITSICGGDNNAIDGQHGYHIKIFIYFYAQFFNNIVACSIVLQYNPALP